MELIATKRKPKIHDKVRFNGLVCKVSYVYPDNKTVNLSTWNTGEAVEPRGIDSAELIFADENGNFPIQGTTPTLSDLQAVGAVRVGIPQMPSPARPTVTISASLTLPTNSLQPHPRNQVIYGEEDVSELVDQIVNSNWIKAIVVNPDTKRIISGHRRWLAAKALGLAIVPVEYRIFKNEMEELEALLLENASREKTPEQKVREADVWVEIEAPLAEQRRLSNLKQGDAKPESADLRIRETGRTSAKAAERVAMKTRTYEKAKKVVRKADELSFAGKVDEARQLLDTLNDVSIDAAYHIVVPLPEIRMPHVSHNSGENEWYTPAIYIAAARRAMGGIDLDPASCEAANTVVCAEQFYSIVDSGLQHDWFGRIWLNPPYSQPEIDQFGEKIIAEYGIGNFDQACVLVNNATETAWFQTLLSIASAVCLLKSRVKFLDRQLKPEGKPLQGQIVFYIGAHVDTFTEAFEPLGKVLYAGQE